MVGAAVAFASSITFRRQVVCESLNSDSDLVFVFRFPLHMLPHMKNNADQFKVLIKEVKRVCGRAKSLNTVFKRIHNRFMCDIKGTGMSRACYTVRDDEGNAKWIMKVEHNTHTHTDEWDFLNGANTKELESFKASEAFPNLASVLVPISAWFTIGESLVLIVPVMEVIPNINTEEWKNDSTDTDTATSEWQDIYVGADADCWSDDNKDGPVTPNGKRMRIIHWLSYDAHPSNIGVLDGKVYLIDYDDRASEVMTNGLELRAERMFA